MIKYILEKKYCVKSVVLNAALFFLSLSSMDTAYVEGKSNYPLFLPLDVVRHGITSHLSFQSISRLGRTCRTFRDLKSIDYICPLPKGCASLCSSFACRALVTDFNGCTKAMAHCALE